MAALQLSHGTAQRMNGNSNNDVIFCEHVGKTVNSGATELAILQNIQFTLHRNHAVAITGRSGSGKSTLLGLLAGLDRPSTGRIVIEGTDITQLDESALARFRQQHMGFIFQQFFLQPALTALENVQIPLLIRGLPVNEARDRAAAMLQQVGLAHRLQNHPATLSGGEQQRVAVARAFVGEPAIVFADEPTGNLDSRSGESVTDLLFQLHGKNTTRIIVTHDETLAAQCQRKIELIDGQVAFDSGAPHNV